MRIIKRYKNRRLYDTERKEYITHNELRHIIRLRLPFRIIDSETEADITLAVLSQLLVGEVGKWKDIKESKDILIEVINRGGEKSMSILRNTFLASIGIYNLTKKKAEEIIDSLIKAGQISQSDRKQAIMELLDRAEESTAKMKDKIVKETSGIQKEAGKVLDKIKQAVDKMPQKKIMAELERLNKKVDELTQKLEKKGK
ncbi:MAG: polyhydroxyalkanoate synthesis regulator DNA-binding domain-containing protein [Candidatus Zixiibacteriota bacterium]